MQDANSIILDKFQKQLKRLYPHYYDSSFIYKPIEYIDILKLRDFIANSLDPAKKFKIRVVGSVLSDFENANDLDLIITKQSEYKVVMSDLRNILVNLKQYGTEELAIRIDPFYRSIPEAEFLSKFEKKSFFYTWHLIDPWFLHNINQVKFQYKMFDLLMVTKKKITQTNYYMKLPFLENSYKRHLRESKDIFMI